MRCLLLVASERIREGVARIRGLALVGARDDRTLSEGLSGPLSAVLGALDAEGLEHRLALEDEKRGRSRRHREASRERDELRMGRVTRKPLAIGNACGGEEPWDERIAGVRRRVHLDRVLRLERIAADFAAKDEVTLHRIPAHASGHDRLGPRAERCDRGRRRVAQTFGQHDLDVAEGGAIGRVQDLDRRRLESLARLIRNDHTTTAAGDVREEIHVGIGADRHRHEERTRIRDRIGDLGRHAATRAVARCRDTVGEHRNTEVAAGIVAGQPRSRAHGADQIARAVRRDAVEERVDVMCAWRTWRDEATGQRLAAHVAGDDRDAIASVHLLGHLDGEPLGAGKPLAVHRTAGIDDDDLIARLALGPLG
ncbi:MAG: hypothetical protein K0S65_6745 [Labilithrix sp.]|nr:hypothetical protein [Labilithrix sp.]